MRASEKYVLIQDIKNQNGPIKYPVVSDALFESLIQINHELEDAILMMEMMKETNNDFGMCPCVMKRLLADVKRLQELSETYGTFSI